MRRLASYVTKHGAEEGPKLYRTLQREASHAGVAARTRKRLGIVSIGPMPRPGQKAKSCCDVEPGGIQKTAKGWTIEASGVRVYLYADRCTIHDDVNATKTTYHAVPQVTKTKLGRKSR
jgi:hypothetical protein